MNDKYEIITASTASFTNWNGDFYSNDILRSAVDTLARVGAKLKGTHFIVDQEGRHENDCKLNRLLQIEPNPIMSSYDFLYKVTTHYFLYNNSFIYCKRDTKGDIEGFYPIDSVSVTILQDPKEDLYYKFRLRNGSESIFRLKDIIHLKRHYNSDLLLGENNDPISSAIKLSKRQNEGLINQIENGATIRGIIKVNSKLGSTTLKKYQEEFTESFLKAENDGGVIVTDTSADFTPVSLSPANIDKDQLDSVRDIIFSYFGVNNNIVTGRYTEEEWNAFYENTIEPYSIQLSQEFTRKIFTDRERKFGNQILFNTDNMLVASTRNKTSMIKTLSQIGVLTKNEIREIFGFTPLETEEGNKIIQSLDKINSDNADEYQLNKTE